MFGTEVVTDANVLFCLGRAKIRIVRVSKYMYSPAIAVSEDKDIFRSIILRKLMKGNNSDVDLVNGNVHTKVGKIVFIHSQDIESKPNSDINQGP